MKFNGYISFFLLVTSTLNKYCLSYIYKNYGLKCIIKPQSLLSITSLIKIMNPWNTCTDSFFIHYAQKHENKQIQINYLIRLLCPKIVTIQITTNTKLYSTIPSLSDHFQSSYGQSVRSMT